MKETCRRERGFYDMKETGIRKKGFYVMKRPVGEGGSSMLCRRQG